MPVVCYGATCLVTSVTSMIRLVYCSYDVNCCLSVWHVRFSNAANYTCLVWCLTIQESVSEDVEGSTYVGCAKLQANPKLDY